MFVSYVNKRDEVHDIVVQDLRSYGMKYRQKKTKHNVQEVKGRRLFKRPLSSLPMETVTMSSGQQLIVPKLVHELCSFVLNRVQTEGLFRKGGSKSRQNEIKLYIDAGCHLTEEHHEIDVASVLKTFFRELPEPLLPYSFHDIFLRCMLLKENQLEAILLCCLLLPTEHINTLTYFMQFLNEVTHHSDYNKMDSYNLSVVIGPTLLPVDEKLAVSATARLSKACELFKILIDNAYRIGLLPDNIINRLGIKSCCDLTEEDALNLKKKKKRRSGSLTRMLNGLKKIVSKSNEESPGSSVTPDLLLTPCITNSSKKRKLDDGFSNRKRKDLINNLPHGSILNAPFAPSSRTPISVDPNPKRDASPSTSANDNQTNNAVKEKHDSKDKWYTKTRRVSQINLKKQWSAVSNQVTSMKKNKARNSCAASMRISEPCTSSRKQSSSESGRSTPPLNSSDPDYIRIPKVEYEEIKNRVLAIEKRISIELDSADNNTKDEQQQCEDVATKEVDGNRLDRVQDEYVKTLNQAEQLSPTTDHLARRLSRELKIRKKPETKIIRSPSARKIGSLRRRSRESDKRTSAVARRQSWHVTTVDVGTGGKSSIGLKRGRPNTVQTGLKTPPIKEPLALLTQNDTATNNVHLLTGAAQNSPVTRSQSLNKVDNWEPVDGFLDKFRTPTNTTTSINLDGCRASIVRLRSQNAGMVLAKTKLFDGLLDTSDTVTSSQERLPRGKSGNIKIGNAMRTAERQQMARIRTLKADERKTGRKSLSPRKKNGVQRHRLQQISQASSAIDNGDDAVKENQTGNVPDLIRSSPVMVCCASSQHVPYIKKMLSVRSPKRLHRTPIKLDYKRTPLKVSSRPMISDC